MSKIELDELDRQILEQLRRFNPEQLRSCLELVQAMEAQQNTTTEKE
ncbi:MAG: hypothetical protein LUE61_09250 [Clostridiales bacterium]|nr:hypothetical protein [Clostridiales bacterium]